MFKTFLRCLTVILFSLLLCSCSDNLDERRHPFFVKGQKLKKEGKFSESAEFFDKYLIINSKSAKTHFELATIYDDNLENSFLACYHYRQYLRYAPPEASKDREAVKQWLVEAERKYYEKLKNEFKDEDELARLKIQLADLKDEHEEYVRRAVRINKKLRQKLKNLTGNSSVKTETKIETEPRAPEQTAETAKTPESSDNKQVTFYIVKQGDTMMRISKQIYGSSKYYKLIFEANRDIMPDVTRLKIGQKLRIPSLPKENDKAQKTDVTPKKKEESSSDYDEWD